MTTDYSSSNHLENYDPLYPDQPVVDLYLPIWSRQSAFANKPAFRWIDIFGKEIQFITYAQLNCAASMVASELLDNFGLSRGDRVMAIYPPGLEFVELLFGSQRAGLVLVPISPPDPSSVKNYEELIQQIKEISPKLILTPPECRLTLHNVFQSAAGRGSTEVDVLGLCTQLVSLNASMLRNCDSYGLKELVLGRDVRCRPSESTSSYKGCKPEDMYLVQYTSGATGFPKATVLTAGAAAHNVRAARRIYEFHPSSVIASWLPTYLDGGLMLVLCTVISGATMVVTSPFFFVQRPVLWLQMISEYGATSTAVPAFALPLTSRKFEKAKRRGEIAWKMDLSQLKNVIIMNEPISQNLIVSFVEKFQDYGLQRKAMAPTYGLAEMCTFVSSSWDSSLEPLPLPTFGDVVASGKLDPDFDIHIVHPETRARLRNGEEGEVWVASASKAESYLDNPSLTARDLRATLAESSQNSGEQQHFLRTGDTGRIIDGYLFVTGRVADVMFLNGRLWHPQYLEVAAFESSSELRPGCVVAFSLIPGMAGRNRSSHAVILVELNCEIPDYCSRPTDLADTIHLGLRLKHGIEASVIGLLARRAIPKTISGKLRRQECRRRFIAGQFQFLECRSYMSSTSCSQHNVADRLQHGLQRALKTATSTSSKFHMPYTSRIMAAL